MFSTTFFKESKENSQSLKEIGILYIKMIIKIQKKKEFYARFNFKVFKCLVDPIKSKSLRRNFEPTIPKIDVEIEKSIISKLGKKLDFVNIDIKSSSSMEIETFILIELSISKLILFNICVIKPTFISFLRLLCNIKLNSKLSTCN